ncbi:sugar-binding transcriptional regulator [Lacisediminihabitans profunda]|uniref:Sugar-binding transcriptional regulator n=1 Tax=Lacisediminihabitans profunda TaxID=2594790 RepID=A0A5C8UV00_9MICO|nr:sugar-binding transcriptional regulator [Lacisediminihabitans profunda]TXN31446.1 sugar-binding transcriptional regulator [Lacisediminihabitans profunda]
MAARDATMSDELLSVRAAELYYDDVKTQDEIGALLGITRWKVGRLLAQARESGIIRIEIVHPRARRLSLEHELMARFGLRDAVVVPVPSDGSTLQARVAEAAADYLQALRPVPRTLGVSWGRTLDEIAERLPNGWSRGVDVVQINGGVSLNTRSSTAAATAVTIARKGGGQATLLPIPAILERRETRLAIEADRAVAGVLERAAEASAYLYSAGVADESSVLVDSGYLSPGDVAELVRKGAVGDVVGRYIDANGAIVDHDLDERTVGLGLDALRAATTSIAVVAGRAKQQVARAIVRSALCTVFVTDEQTAAALVEENKS